MSASTPGALLTISQLPLCRGTRLALKLLYVKRRSAASPKAGWVSDLPVRHDLPWRWRPADLLRLHYSPLAHKAGQKEVACAVKPRDNCRTWAYCAARQPAYPCHFMCRQYAVACTRKPRCDQPACTIGMEAIFTIHTSLNNTPLMNDRRCSSVENTDGPLPA